MDSGWKNEHKMEEEPGRENWRQFQGTELGSLMSQIYATKPKINYPKPKQSSKTVADNPHGNFIGGKVDSVDPRKVTRNPVDLKVPSFSKRRSSDESSRPHAVDIIPRRRGETTIRAELDEIKMRQNYYRPAYRQAVSSEEEKQRLSEICTHKGGKGLPAVGLMPVGEAPFETEARMRQQRLQAEHRAKKSGVSGGMGVGGGVSGRGKASLSSEEQLAIQITSEIDDRREYLEELKRDGDLSGDKEASIKAEIAQRLGELRRLGV